ncbi:hypothetical protein FEDK69T_30770 [Flavobacterium enshiense DK69]|uniref:TonB C-terminal domain-containing protein n=1 Tax=Flavobacterium enshiense DK69 TaxID=1107311 RepID=V6RZC2_9FLAO|nr:TonB family protein [Flavobacterium enshiense]ESU19821.1 hypothetical protein FEDK69T_30770 [Flavobacterium enshiense DK69]KGO93119.1 hypothetical protein Q767_15180 [Flavobacterium enshiense DK69]
MTFNLKHFLIIISFVFTKSYSQDGKIYEVTLPDGSKHIEQYFKYPGGKEALLKDLRDNFYIPKQAIKDKVSGQIILAITIDTTGIAKGKILKSLRPDVDSAAVQVVRKLKISEPAKQDNKKVPFTLSFPITI